MKFLKVKRLRKKAGSILFIVIIVMAMLIALATGAYYTAYTARISIVDNYNYSQLYLSATSISDMAINALANTQTDTTYNDFTQFTSAVQAMEHDDIASGKNVVRAASNTNVDSIPGMVDSYSLEVTLEEANAVMKSDGTKWEDRYYTIKARAGYAEDTIEIDTLLYCQVAFTETSDPGSIPPGSTVYVEHYKTVTVPTEGDAPVFDSFFITTGQNTQHQVVKISVNKITDDAYFKNDITYFSYNQNQNANNTFYKNLTSTGSICFDGKFSIDKSIQPDKQWYIGEDLLLMGDNAGVMDLGTEGVLYVGEDLVINNQQGIKAKYIYVLGDLYLTAGQSLLDCAGLYVSGNIYTTYDASAYSNSNGSFGTLSTSNSNPYNFGSNTEIYVNKSADEAVSKGKVNANLISTSKWTTTAAEQTLQAQMDEQTYANYQTGTYDGTTVDGIDVFTRKFEIDLGFTTAEDGTLVPNHADDSNYTVTVTDSQNVTVTIKAGNCTIDDITNCMTNCNYTYVFDVQGADSSTVETLNLKDENGNATGETGKAAYVRLNPNCTITGSGNGATFADATTANDAFTWLGVGDGTNSNGYKTTILTNAEKNDALVFEMGTYDKNGDGTDDGVTTYFQRQKNYVGSETVYNAMSGNVFQGGNYSSLLDTNSKLNNPDSVFNNVYLISTSDKSNGMQIESTDSSFSGYAYAPYMNYTSTGENNAGTAIFGGLIVNAYDVDGQRDYTYVVPNNSVLGEVFSKMKTTGAGGSSSYQVLDYVESINTPGVPIGGSGPFLVPSGYAYSQGASNYIG